MASRISQMRNGLQPYPQTPQHQQQQALNESIERTRAVMQQVQNASNKEAALTQILENNPNTAMIANMLSNNNNLEAIAQWVAQTKGYDLNYVISQLSGGM